MRRPLQTIHDGVHAAVVAPLTRRFPSWVTPTSLTLLRLGLTIPLAVALIKSSWPVAAGLYGIAVLTDAFDGELARQRQRTSTFGIRLDPTVDKVLHGVVFLVFLPAAPILLRIVIALDFGLFVVGVIRVHREGADAHVSANIFGKWKFAAQAVSILLLFVGAMIPSPALGKSLQTMLVAAIALALLSLVGYSTAGRKTTSRVNP